MCRLKIEFIGFTDIAQIRELKAQVLKMLQEKDWAKDAVFVTYKGSEVQYCDDQYRPAPGFIRVYVFGSPMTLFVYKEVFEKTTLGIDCEFLSIPEGSCLPASV